MMGEPAGGSLTADQWLVAATIVCPIIVSLHFRSVINIIHITSHFHRFLRSGMNIALVQQKQMLY
jgi:hypothetical protein